MLDKESVKGLIQLLRSKGQGDSDLAFEILFNQIDAEQIVDLPQSRLYRKLAKEIKKCSATARRGRYRDKNTIKRQVYDNIAWKINKFTKQYAADNMQGDNWSSKKAVEECMDV